MLNKVALIAVSLVALAAVAFLPAADLSAEDDMILLSSDASDEEIEATSLDEGGEKDRNYLYEGVLILVVVLACLAYLHVSYYSKKKKQ